MDDRLSRILKNVFTLSDKEFREDLEKEDISNWDSLRHMDLIATIEAEYDITLSMQEILSINSFPALTEVLKNYI